jgi:hypothetical protein
VSALIPSSSMMRTAAVITTSRESRGSFGRPIAIRFPEVVGGIDVFDRVEHED